MRQYADTVALIAADGAAVVTYTERFWQTLAARPSDAAPDDSAAAAVIEMLFRQGLLQQPISIADLADGASWNGLARRALLVVRIEGTPRQPVRLVCYATRPATLAPHADLAEAFAHHASLALEAVTERDNLNRAVAARHRVGLAQGILMTRRQLTTDQAFALLTPLAEHPHQGKNDRSNRHPDRRSAGLPRRLRTDDTAPTVSQTRRGPAGTSSV
jgi:ANTAR domain